MNAANELAKERSREAAERTLTSWIQSCLTLIAFGFGFDRIVKALNHPSLQSQQTFLWESIVPYVAMSAIALGVFLLLLAIAVHHSQMKALALTGSLSAPGSRPLVLATAAIVLFAIFAAIVLLIKAI